MRIIVFLIAPFFINPPVAGAELKGNVVAADMQAPQPSRAQTYPLPAQQVLPSVPQLSMQDTTPWQNLTPANGWVDVTNAWHPTCTCTPNRNGYINGDEWTPNHYPIDPTPQNMWEYEQRKTMWTVAPPIPAQYNTSGSLTGIAISGIGKLLSHHRKNHDTDINTNVRGKLNQPY